MRMGGISFPNGLGVTFGLSLWLQAIGAMLPQLRSLNAAHTGITGDALRAISNLKLLEELNLDSCDLIVDQSFTHLRLLTTLKRCSTPKPKP